MNPGKFFAELKRRNVYKVAVVYAVIAWLLIQAASILFPTFEAPLWVMKVFIALIVFGFPIAVVLAWAFELTPEGLKRTEDVTPAESITRHTGRNLTAVIVIVALAAAGLLIFRSSQTRGTRQIPAPESASSSSVAQKLAIPLPVAESEKSVAVLPFENLSSDKENEFFAQGIQDEIITTLSKISGLKVISRTSTARYKSAPENLREIARELRVSNILEGSVQKAGDRVHINVQLIQAETDGHLWAQTFDRQLTDIFTVEGEVAKSIADSLSATLSPQEKARVESKPTENADAYVLYLRARHYQTSADTLLQDFKTAAQLYGEAIALDPNFALAHARLSEAHSTIYHWFEPTDARKQKGREEAEASLRLQPNLGEGHLARGLGFYYLDGDYERALGEFDLASRALPNDGDVGLFMAAVRRRQGRFAEAIEGYKRAELVDPRNPVMLYDASQTYYLLRNWKGAADAMDRALALSPESITIRIQRAYIPFFSAGTTAAIKAALATIPADTDPDGTVTYARWDVSLIDRDFDAATKAVAACRVNTITTPNGAPLPKIYLQAYIALMQGSEAEAQAGLEAARPMLEKTLRESSDDPARHAHLGLLYALMGRKEDALREGRRAVDLKPVSTDAIDGAIMETFLALIYARAGRPDDAIPLLERILTRPSGVDYSCDSVTLSDLRFRWEWDPLRNDPRFQKLIAGPEKQTIYK